MPTVAQIEQALFQLAPKDLAFDWDNVGHLEGSPDQEVQRVLVALDVTENVVSEAEKLGCQLIVSHHPLMNVRWHQAEMQTLRPDRYLGRLLRRLVKADISVISMHTNLDIAPGGVNDALIAQTLDAFRSRELLKLKVLLETAPKPPREIAEEIAAKTQSEVVQVVGGSLIFFKENPELHEPKDKKKKITGTKNPNRPSVRKKIHEKKLAEERKTAARRKAERNFRRSRDI